MSGDRCSCAGERRLGAETSIAARGFLAGIVLLGAHALLSAQGSAPAQNDASIEMQLKEARLTQPNIEDYEITPDDLLEVYVFDVPEISRQYRVSPGGAITMPLLSDPITAAGRTIGQLSQIISERLRTAGLVSNPRVTVEVKESRFHSVAVTGAVRKPQIFPVFSRTTLLDVLSQAEGLAEDAGDNAIITRGELAARALGLKAGHDRERYDAWTVSVDLRLLLERGDSSLNLDLFPGDRVTVQRSGVVYVVGAVNRSGGFPLKDTLEKMTVLKAVALAQDLKGTAVRNKALIIRRDSKGENGRVEIPVNLAEILAGRKPDQELQADDILFIPDSTGSKALRRALEAAVQITTGVIIWRR